MSVQVSSTAPGVTRARQAASVEALGAELTEYVGLRWPNYYPAHRTMDPKITLTPRHFGFSLIFQVDLVFANGRSERFMIKVRRQQKNGSFVRSELSDRILALSRAEHVEHLKAFEFFGGNNTEGLSVVRPLDFIESYNAFVVEHAIGADLSKLVKDESPAVPEALRRCGIWWRKFHRELHGAADREWDAQVMDGFLERRFTKLQAIGVPVDLLVPLREEIASVVRRVPPSRVPVSLVHGDCKLRHVWATTEGIQVLDFGNAKPGDSWVDPAALVVELSLYSLWTRRLDSSTRIADIRALLCAYFGGRPPEAFALYVVDCLLKKWHRRLRKWGAGTGLARLHSSLRTARLDKPFERLYIDRWFTTQIRAWLALAEGEAPAWLAPVVERPCR